MPNLSVHLYCKMNAKFCIICWIHSFSLPFICSSQDYRSANTTKCNRLSIFQPSSITQEYTFAIRAGDLCLCANHSLYCTGTLYLLFIVRLLLAIVNRSFKSPHISLTQHLSFMFLQPGSFPRNDASCKFFPYISQPDSFPRNDASLKFFPWVTFHPYYNWIF